MSYRVQKVATVIHEHLAMILQREVRDPRVSFVTISEVTVSKDLSVARVYFTVFDEENAEDIKEVLQHASGYLRTLLGKHLRLRQTPYLKFIYDDTTVKANKLCSLIDRVCDNT